MSESLRTFDSNSALRAAPPWGAALGGVDALSGNWITEVTLPVNWWNMVVVRAEGPVKLRGLVQRSKVGPNKYTERFALCGIRLPSFYTVKKTTHRIIVPDNLFDQHFFPASEVYAAQGSSASLSGGVVTLSGGVARAAAGEQAIDIDFDGRPGFTALVDASAGLASFAPPTCNSPLASLWVGMRCSFSYQVHNIGADRLEGTASCDESFLETCIFGGLTAAGVELEPHEANWLRHHFNIKKGRGAATVVMQRVGHTPSPLEVRGAHL